MDKEEIKGKFEQAKGAAKEKIGHAVNDEEMEAEGQAERAGGKVREGIGNIKDKARKVADDVTE